jgi:hypothetical protein
MSQVWPNTHYSVCPLQAASTSSIVSTVPNWVSWTVERTQMFSATPWSGDAGGRSPCS